MTVKNADIVAANLGQPQSPTDPQLQVKLDGLWEELHAVQQKNSDVPRPMRTTNESELIFSCDGVPLTFTQMGILRGVKEQHSKHNCGMGFVQNETTTYLEEHGLIRMEDYPSRDGNLRTLHLTERSKNNAILNHVTGTQVKICGEQA